MLLLNFGRPFISLGDARHNLPLPPPLPPLTHYSVSRLSVSAPPPPPPSLSPLVPVSDITIMLTFIDHTGSRVTVPARIGQTLHAAATQHGVDLGPASVGGVEERANTDEWTEDLFGEGPNTAFDHVMIPKQWAKAVGKAGPMETMMLDQMWEEDEIKPESRLACMITLVKEMDGMSVYIPPGLCVNE